MEFIKDGKPKSPILSQMAECSRAMSVSYHRTIEVLKSTSAAEKKKIFLGQYEEARDFLNSAHFAIMNRLHFEEESN